MVDFKRAPKECEINTLEVALNIVVAGDDKYLPGLIVTIYSAWKNNRSARFYVINNGLSPDNLAVLLSMARNVGIDLIILNLDDDTLKSLPTWGYFTSTTYARLLVPQLLPDESKAIYLDTDVVVDRSLEPLWSLGLGSNLVGAVAEGFAPPEELANTRLNNESYFNAGVLVLNLDRWRSEDTTGSVLSYVQSGAPMLFLDQTALNVMLKDRVTYLSRQYNFLAVHYTKLPKMDVAIYHYLGKLKPWNNPNTPLGFIFDYYADELAKMEILGINFAPKRDIDIKSMRRHIFGLMLLRRKYLNKTDKYLHARSSFKKRRRDSASTPPLEASISHSIRG
jgi:lipopolysaccharide biosynthesis glycosyltransferase